MATNQLKMKNYTYILVFLLGVFTNAQTALYNSAGSTIGFGTGAQIGLHTNLINNGTFNDDKGFVGFYGDEPINISGMFSPVFYNTELFLFNNLTLDIPISIGNNTNFIEGNIVTPRNLETIYVNYLQNATPNGANDNSKVDGYVIANNAQNFNFPVGDAEYHRPLVINSDAVNTQTRCAYYFESPNAPSTFSTNTFSTVRKPRIIDYISVREFWHLEANETSNITLSWNFRSNLAAITDDIAAIIVVGWSKNQQRWVNLGNIASSGDVIEGIVISDSFIPNDYEIITLGALGTPTEILTFDNYLVTPNGDGKNDELVLNELETLSPNNHIQIFDRNGLKVFEKENYRNEFNGFSNTGNFVVQQNKGLPSGIYFYIINLKDLEINYQGFLYLTR